MSVNLNNRLKGVFIVLVIVMLSTNSLLIKRKSVRKENKSKQLGVRSKDRVHSETNEKRDILNQKRKLKKKSNTNLKSRKTHKAVKSKAQTARKLLSLSNKFNKKPQTKEQRALSKNRKDGKSKALHKNRRLSRSDGTQLLSLALIAAIVFIIAEAPLWGLIIFSVPIFLEVLTSITGFGCGRTLKLLKPKIRKLKGNRQKKFNKQLVNQEQRKIVLFLNKNHIKLGSKPNEPQLYKVIGKYLQSEYHMKEENYKTEVHKVLHALFKNRQKIMDKFNGNL